METFLQLLWETRPGAQWNIALFNYKYVSLITHTHVVFFNPPVAFLTSARHQRSSCMCVRPHSGVVRYFDCCLSGCHCCQGNMCSVCKLHVAAKVCTQKHFALHIDSNNSCNKKKKIVHMFSNTSDSHVEQGGSRALLDFFFGIHIK